MPSGIICPPLQWDQRIFFSEECCVEEAVLAGVRLAQVVPPAMPFFRAVKTTEDLELLIIY